MEDQILYFDDSRRRPRRRPIRGSGCDGKHGHWVGCVVVFLLVG